MRDRSPPGDESLPSYLLPDAHHPRDAGSAKRPNRAATMIVIGLALVGAALAILMWSWSSQGSSRIAETNVPSTGPTTLPRATNPLVTAFVVPNLVGLSWEDALVALRAAGVLEPEFADRRFIADDAVAAGSVRTQSIVAGVRAPSSTRIAVTFSMGGPAIPFSKLPATVKMFASDLVGYDESEPVLVVATARGTAYKTDDWLFGPCDAVRAAYRTFVDPTYGDKCY